jgi:hypothetical protein
MRRADRSTVNAPASLTNPALAGALELIAARTHYGGNAEGSYGFKAYKGADVSVALRKLFHGKCAYCESFFASTAPVDIEHYRPKGAVEGAGGHRGYWWLAMKWENLLPSCIDCNRRRRQTTVTPGMTLEQLEVAFLQRPPESTGKKDAFPIRGANHASNENDPLDNEDPLLLDPTNTNDDPARHLRWPLEGETAMVVPTLAAGEEDPYAVASIHVYGLNRLDLVQQRTRLLQELRASAKHIRSLIDLSANAAQPIRHQLIDLARGQVALMEAKAGPKEPHSELAAAFVKQFRLELQLEE